MVQAFEVLTDWDKRESYNQELQHALISGDDDYTGASPVELCMPWAQKIQFTA